MARDVSRFPDTVNVPATVLYSDFSNDGRGREGKATAQKRKRNFPKLFRSKMSKDSKGHHHDREVEQPYHPPLLLPLSISAFPQKYPLLERKRSIQTSTPSHSTFSSARTKPKLPHLEIPQAIITKPQCQDDLIIPPTPRLKGISTKETIRALGLIQPIPLARGAPAFTNPAIFGEGLPTFSSDLPSHFGGGNSIPAISHPVSTNTMPYTALTGDTPSSSLSMAPKSTPINRPGSARPLPPIPKKTLSQFPSPSWGPSPEARVTVIPDPIARSRPLPPHNGSMDNGAPRGRRLPPVPLVLVKHHHTKSVPELSPPPSYESSVSPKEGPRQPALSTAVAPTPNSTAAPISKSIVAPDKLSAVTPDVVVHLPTPATNVDFQRGERVVEDTLAPDIARLTQSGLDSSSTIPFISSRGNMLPPPRQPSSELSLGGLKPAPRRDRPPKVDRGAWTCSPSQRWNRPDDVQPQLHSRSRKKDNNPPVPKTSPQKGPRRSLSQPKEANVLSYVLSRVLGTAKINVRAPRRLYSRGRNL